MDHKDTPFNLWVKRLALIPVVLAPVAIVCLVLTNPPRLFLHPLLSSLLTFAFQALIPLAIAFIAGRAFLKNGLPSVLFMGSGLLCYGLACSILSYWMEIGIIENVNLTVTLHNLSILLTSLLFAISSAMAMRGDAPTKQGGLGRAALLAAAYASFAVLIACIAFAAYHDATPAFFSQDSGATTIRAVVLLTTIIFLTASSSILMLLYGGNTSTFTYWYSLSLFLFMPGIFGIFFQTAFGSALNWASRISQYLAALYLLIAALSARQDAQRKGLSIFDVFTAFFTAESERKRVNDALRASEALFRSLTSLAPVGVYQTDPQGLCTFANPKWLDMAGMTLDQALGNGWGKALHPEDRERVVAAWDQMVASQGHWGLSYRFQTPEGKITWVYGLAVATRDDAGRCIGYIGTNTDITERKQAEEALRRSEERLRFSQHIARLGQWDLDLVANKLHWSPGLFELFEIDPAVFDPSYEAFLALVHPEDRLAVDQAYTSSLEAKTPYSIIHRLLMPDGRVKWLKEDCRHEFGPAGEPIRSLGITQDVTELKHSEESLRRSEKRYRTLFEKNMDAIALKESYPPRVKFANPAFAELFGYTASDLREMQEHDSGAFWRLFHPDDLSLVQASVKDRVASHADSVRYEARILRKDGATRWVEVSGTRVEHDGAPASLTIFRDITERKQAERFRDDVERIIRHDIKAPLVSLHNMAELAFAEGMDDEFRSYIPGLMHGIQQAIKLVGSSEKMRQMELGSYTVKAKWFDLHEVLRNVGLSLDKLIASRQVRLVLQDACAPDASEAAALFYGEEFLIEDLLMNLAKNAVEAAPVGGQATIACDFSQAGQRIVIHNSGAIPEAIRDTFFAKYSSAGKAHGTGLGTYSAWLIARAHGGDITFASSQAEGTTVTVLLPCPNEARPLFAPKYPDPV